MSERGSVTVHALWVGMALFVATLVAVQVAVVVRAEHEVASAADLAALAGSRAAFSGDDGCEAARDVARRNGADLVRCRMDYAVATVTARDVTTRWWGHRWTVEAKARAAPDSYVSEGGS